MSDGGERPLHASGTDPDRGGDPPPEQASAPHGASPETAAAPPGGPARSKREEADLASFIAAARGKFAPRTPGRALMHLAPEIPVRAAWTPRVSYGLMAAGVAVALGAGLVTAAHVLTGQPASAKIAQAAVPPDPTVQLLHHVEDEVRALKVGLDAVRANSENTKQDESIRALKRSVEALRQDVDGVKTASNGAVVQLGTKIDKLDRDPTAKLAELTTRLDRLDHEPGPKLADIAARLDRLDRDPGPKLADITARLDRIERQVSSQTPTGSVSASARSVPVPTPSPVSTPEVKTPSKPAAVEGWSLRDVYDGVALVQGRAGGLREIAPGEYLPGVGEVRSIERRGRNWVVVTSRGTIEADNRW